MKEKALGQKVLTAVSPGQLMVKIVKDELAELMGGTESEFMTKGNPAVILIAGLQGSGKTTFSGKLANYLKTKKGLVALAGGGRYLPPCGDRAVEGAGRTDQRGCIQRAGK